MRLNTTNGAIFEGRKNSVNSKSDDLLSASSCVQVTPEDRATYTWTEDSGTERQDSCDGVRKSSEEGEL